MSPRATRATEPARANDSAAITNELARLQARARELDDKSIALAQEFGAAQRRLGVVIADAANAATIAAARRTVAELRSATDELVSARAVISDRQRALRRELAPLQARETTAAAIAALAAGDAVVRRMARELAPLMTAVERAVSAQSVAERQARAASGTEAGIDLRLLREAGGDYVTELREVAAAVAYYASQREAGSVERNGPVEARFPDAPSHPSEVSAA